MEILDYVVYALAALYILLVIFPIIQLIRIYQRAPNLRWTIQKSFLLLVLISSTVRVVFFAIVPYINIKTNFFMLGFRQEILFAVLNSVPDVLYFTTYTLLILFWAEIIHHARNQSLSFPNRLRPTFYGINIVVYFFLIVMWCLLFFFPDHSEIVDIGCNIFFVGLYLGTALAFTTYGGRLYVMLKQFPIDSRGKRSKLTEVGWVTVVCAVGFTVRAALLLYSSISDTVDIQYWFVGGYYLLVEILPAIFVLFILRKLPPKKDKSVPTLPNKGQFDRYESADYYKVNIAGDVN